MNFRNILVSIGCFAAAAGVGSAKPVQAGDLRTGNDSVASDSSAPDSAASPGGTCAVGGDQSDKREGCERIDGRVRIDAVTRIPDLPRFGGRTASPIAMRTDDGTGPRGHLYLQGGLDELEPVRR